MAQAVSSCLLLSWSLRSTELTCGLDGLDGDEELLGDLLVLVAARDEAHHLTLPGREPVELLVDLGDLAGGRAEGIEDEAGEARAEDGVAVGHPPDRGEQLLGVDRLGDVAAGAGPDDGDDVLGRVGHREREEAHRHAGARLHAVARPDDVGAAVPVAAGQVDVEEHDVGLLLLDDLHGRLDRSRLTGDLEGERAGPRCRREGRQLGAHAGAEHVVVVDDDDADGPRVGHGACSWVWGSWVPLGVVPWVAVAVAVAVAGAGAGDATGGVAGEGCSASAG